MQNWNKICGISGFFLFFYFSSSAQMASKKPLKSPEIRSGNIFHPSSITPDLYTKNLSFFCKKELQFEKSTKIPLKFRLGSINYVNYLDHDL